MKPTQPKLSAQDQAALDDAVHALADEHRERWGPAMRWLIEHPEPARPAMVEIVARGGGPGNMEVERAAAVLGEIGHADDVAVLAQALARGGELAAWSFAQPLSVHRAPAALDALIAASAADDPWVVRAAALALGARGDEAGRAVLEKLLDDARSEVRYTVVQALIDLGPQKSREALQRRKAVETDGEVKGAIRKALAK